MNQQSNKTSRVLMVAGVLVFVMIAAYFTIIQQKLNQVAASQAQLDALQGQYASLKRVADQKPLYLSLIHQVQMRLRGVELTADARTYVPSYLKQIEALAKRDGMTVTAIIPQPLVSPTPAPAAAGGPNAKTVQDIPVIGAPLKSAGHALNSSNTVTAQTNEVAAATGATPIAGGPPLPATADAGAPDTTLNRNVRPGSPRSSAIAYLNQSFSQVPINMEMAGTYVQLQRFLRDLNKFPKLIGVGSMTLSSTRGTVGETPKLHVVLPIVAYRLSPSAPPPAAVPAAGSGD